MFREMRRNKQLLPMEECIKILKNNTSGILSLMGDEGYPYGVPLSYVYADNSLYFHCAKEGHKIDAIKNCDKASFCIVSQDNVQPEEFNTYFRSVILFGRVSIIADDSEKLRTIKLLADKYSPNVAKDKVNDEINIFFSRLCMVRFEIEHITGKESLDLVKMRKS